MKSPDYQPEAILIRENGFVWYQAGFFAEEESCFFFQQLCSEISWVHDTIKMYGREIITRRKVAWYGNQPYDYRYSGVSRHALPWTAELGKIKERVQMRCGINFNSCLLNMYHNGSEGMGWHSDAEPSLRAEAPIASVSFGQGRRFQFRKKNNPSHKLEVLLEHGSLLLMDAESQRNWQHCLPPSGKSLGPRINLTFRDMKEGVGI